MKLIPIGENRTELFVNGNLIFFSYQTPVAAWIGGKAYRTQYKHSKTTTRHINKWLDGARAEEKPQQFFDSLT